MILKVMASKLNPLQLYSEQNILINGVTAIALSQCYIIDIKPDLKNKKNKILTIEYLDKKFGKNLASKVQHIYLEKSIVKYYNLKVGKKLPLNKLMLNVNNIKISAISIGKGYAGNIKKNKFKRGPMSHGSKHHRLQGSLGAGTTPGRVFPGKKMSGRLGGNLRSFNNICVINTNVKNHIVFLKVAVPGKYNNKMALSLKETECFLNSN